MAAVIGNVRADLTAGIASFTDGFKEAAGQVRTFAKTVDGVGGSLKGFGTILTAGITAPLLAAGVASIKFAMDFQKSMAEVEDATNSTAEQTKLLGVEARKLGVQTALTTDEVTKVFATLGERGIFAEDVLNGVGDAAANFAAAAGDVEGATDLASKVMQKFQIDAGDMGRTLDLVTGAMDVTRLDLADYAAGLGGLSAAAITAGVDFETFNLTLAATADLFKSGKAQAKGVSEFFTAIVNPSKEAAEMAKRLGLTFKDAQGNIKPLGAIAEDLRAKLGKLNDGARVEALTKLFGAGGLGVAVGFMNQGAAGLDKLAVAMGGVTSAGEAAIGMRTLPGTLATIKDAILSLAVTVGDTFVPVLAVVGDHLKNFALWLTELPAGAVQFGVALAALAAAVGPVVWAFGALAALAAPLMTTLAGMAAAIALVAGTGGFAGLLAILGPVGLAVAAVVAVFALFKADVVGALKTVWQYAQTTLGPPLQSLFEQVVTMAKAVGAAFKQVFESEAAKALGRFAEVFLRVVGRLVVDVLHMAIVQLTTFLKVVSGVVATIAKLLSGDFAGAWRAALGVVRTITTGIIDAVAALLPGVSKHIRALQEWLHKTLPAIFDAPAAAMPPAGKKVVAAVEATAADVKAKGAARFGEAGEEAGNALGEGLGKGAGASLAKAGKTIEEKWKELVERQKTGGQKAAEDALADIDLIEARAKAGKISAAEAAERAARAGYDAIKGGSPALKLEPIKVKVEPIISDDALKTADAALKDMAEDLKKQMGDAWSRVKDIGLGTLEEWVNTGKFNWKRLVNDLIRNWDDTMRVLGDIWSKTSALMSSAKTGGASGGGGGKVGKAIDIASSVASIFGGFRANGGPVQPGRVYMTGERGPEAFIPRTAGTILPHGSGDGGPPQTTVIINANDAVLASTVAGWVRQGMQVAEQRATFASVAAARELIPQEMARDAGNSFI
jgi:TP901 family phage tail tape measure protein